MRKTTVDALSRCAKRPALEPALRMPPGGLRDRVAETGAKVSRIRNQSRAMKIWRMYQKSNATLAKRDSEAETAWSVR